MKVQSKVSIFSMAFIVACAMGVANDAHAGLFRSKAKYAQDQREKAQKSWDQIDENGARRGVGYVAKKTAKAIKAQMKADATQAEIDASLAASEEARRRFESSRSTRVEIETTKTTTASTEIGLSQSPLFVDQVNGRCPDGYAIMNDGSCGNTYFRQRGPCADDKNVGQGKDDLGQGKDDLGQGKDDLGQGKDDLGQGKDPVCKDNEKLVLDGSGKKKCMPEKTKHVDPVKPIRTKEDCAKWHKVVDPKTGLCVFPKKEEPKKVEPKKEEPKKVEPKKDEPKKEEPKKEEPKKEEVKKEECHDPCGTKEVKKEECHDPCGQKTVQNDRTIHVEGNFKNKELVNDKKGFLGLNKLFGRKRLVTGTFTGDISEDKALDLIEGNYLTANNKQKNLGTSPEIGKYEAEYNQKYGIQPSKTGGTAN